MSSNDLILRPDLKGWKPTGSIIEIGPQRKGGEGSSLDLYRFANSFGVDFQNVDFSQQTFERARSSVGDRANLSDGKKFVEEYDGEISILYLDNYDIANSDAHFEDLNRRTKNLYQNLDFHPPTIVEQNLMSARVHLEQAIAAFPKLTEKCLVGLDDTFYRGYGRCWFGKGALAVPYLLTANFRILANHRKGLLLGRGWQVD